MYRISKVPKEMHDGLYQQLEFLDKFFKQHNITYWINGGTLLGSHRESRIILWDDDADIGINEKDRGFIIEKLRPWASQHGYQLWDSVHGFELRKKSSNNEYTIKTDIFLYSLSKENGEARYILTSDRSRKQWPNDYFLPEEIKSIKNIKFGDILVSTISNPKRYLTAVYGTDYMTHMYLDFNHLVGKPHVDKGVKRPISDVVIIE